MMHIMCIHLYCCLMQYDSNVHTYTTNIQWYVPSNKFLQANYKGGVSIKGKPIKWKTTATLNLVRVTLLGYASGGLQPFAFTTCYCLGIQLVAVQNPIVVFIEGSPKQIQYQAGENLIKL